MMKISKDDLLYIFECADDPDQSVHGGLDMDDVRNSLIDNELEIEGYERADHFADADKKVDEWTKFDPNDESTFPKYCEEIILARWSEQYQHFNVLAASFFTDDKFYVPHTTKEIYESPLIYWRPLPKPPQETEVGK